MLSLKHTFAFGKHTNLTIADVIQVDPGYIFWCVMNTDHTFDTRVLAMAQVQLKAERNNKRRNAFY